MNLFSEFVMGNRAVNFVRESRRAGGFAQAVLLYLADCMNDVTGQCNPSRDTIAEFFSSEDSPCTIKRVERALARLRELGFIVSTRVPYSRQTEFGMEGGWSNSYTLVGYETGVTPKTCVTPILSGGHPQNGQGVTPILSGGHPQNGGINHKEPEENHKEPEDRAHSNVSLTLTPAEKPKRKRAAPKRRIPFDENSHLPDDWREDLEAKYPTLNLDEEFERFVSWHQAKGTVYADWKAAFRNWLTNAIRYAAQKAANNTNGGHRGPAIDRNFSYGTLDLSQFDYTQ